MSFAVIGLLVSAFVIYLSCEYFVNGIEWVGERFRLSEGAIGTVLAAFGTALPESAITLIAVVFGHGNASKQIGVGAALGGPLVLSTLAYGIVGLIFIYYHSKDGVKLSERIDQRVLSRDQGWFLWIFSFKALLGVVTFAFKPWLGALFFAAYIVYCWRALQSPDDIDDELEMEPLKLRPHDILPTTTWIFLQTGLAVVAIFIASQMFVHQLEVIGPWLGLLPQLTALLLSPIATEMPEIMNAFIWVKQGKEKLALCNISGSMMIQATIPSALGIVFTPWRFDPPLVLAAIVTLLSIGGLYLLLRWGRLTGGRLALFGVFYLLFACCTVLFSL